MVYIFSYAKLNTNFELTKKATAFYAHYIYIRGDKKFFCFFSYFCLEEIKKLLLLPRKSLRKSKLNTNNYD